MALPNDGIKVTPGSGATVATHSPAGSNTTEYQVVMLSRSYGALAGTENHYGLAIPYLDATVAHNYLWELFNQSGSAVTVTMRGIYPIPCGRIARTGALAQQVDFFRTTTISSGGSVAMWEASNSTMSSNFFRFDTNDPALTTSNVTCKTEMTSITTGSRLFDFNVFVEETNPANSLIQHVNIIPGGSNPDNKGIVVRVGTGVACRQGPIASVGSVGWFIDFTTNP